MRQMSMLTLIVPPSRTLLRVHHNVFLNPVLGFGGLGKPALVHYTVANSIFVAGARARRGRRREHFIDAGSITAMVI